ncbi:MAG: glutamate--tRNA ligase [Flavobacteriaceae bacterium]
MHNPVRVRFAPSPTGPLHIGGVRTALFNYLFAKKHGGKTILRIEDTDQNRYVEGAEAYITKALEWCGIVFDEGPLQKGPYGPYRQSERKHLYRSYADQLVKNGKAYYAFDTAEALDAHRKGHEAKGKTFIYNWHNRLKLDNSLTMDAPTLQKRLASGAEYVIRFYSPQDKTITLTDLIRGEITIDTNILDDKVLFKSDGMPTYHLANIVDDHLMEITHVIRGEEWLPSLALHQLLYEAFEWTPPAFAHLPLIMKPTGKGKLSKRDGEKGGFPIYPLSWRDSLGYKEAGYFKEAVVNFLAMLGWNPGTEQEIFSMEELQSEFTLERVNKSGARFDPEKTKWYNQQWLQQKTNTELARLFMPYLQQRPGYPIDFPLLHNAPDEVAYVEKVIGLIKERALFIQDFWELGNFFFKAPTSYDAKAVKKQWKQETPEIMGKVSNLLASIDGFSAQNVENAVKEWIQTNQLSFGKVMPPLRLVIVGDMKGPHIFDIISLIGKEETLARIEYALQNIHTP